MQLAAIEPSQRVGTSTTPRIWHEKRLMKRLPMHARAFIVMLFVVLLVPSPSRAIDGVIRDAEVEALMHDFTRPILHAAGYQPDAVKIVIVNSLRFDAFVMDGRRIFLNAGAILETATPEQLIGVIAHEVGHLKGGHLIRQRQELKNAQTLAVVGAMLGVSAAIAGSALGAPGKDTVQAAQGILLGSQGLATRTFLKYKRSEELNADRAAVTFLEKAGLSPAGMLEIFETLRNSTVALTQSEGFLATHPAPRDRMNRLRALVENSPSRDAKVDPELARRHALSQAKVLGFLTPTLKSAFSHYPKSDRSLPARYARAIATFRFRGAREAIPLVDNLIASDDANPYFHELKGQIFLESGNANQALKSLQRAVNLSNGASQIRQLYAHALLEKGGKRNLQIAISQLERVLAVDKENPEAFRLLARGYAETGKIPRADLAAAEAFFLEGNRADAVRLATRAMSALKKGSPSWIRANDLITRR